jgi:hypothetical protein
VTVNHDEGISASGWVNGLSQEHQPKSQDLDENIDPQRIAKSLIASDTNEGTTEVTAE